MEDRLADTDLIKLGTKNMTKEKRFRKAFYAWSAKGVLYEMCKCLGHVEDGKGLR